MFADSMTFVGFGTNFAQESSEVVRTFGVEKSRVQALFFVSSSPRGNPVRIF